MDSTPSPKSDAMDACAGASIPIPEKATPTSSPLTPITSKSAPRTPTPTSNPPAPITPKSASQVSSATKSSSSPTSHPSPPRRCTRSMTAAHREKMRVAAEASKKAEAACIPPKVKRKKKTRPKPSSRPKRVQVTRSQIPNAGNNGLFTWGCSSWRMQKKVNPL